MKSLSWVPTVSRDESQPCSGGRPEAMANGDGLTFNTYGERAWDPVHTYCEDSITRKEAEEMQRPHPANFPSDNEPLGTRDTTGALVV
ncbi:unnamed protein product, partial [Iphiclides podalirius]